MISEHELRKRQSEFEGTRQEMRKEFEKGDSERRVFLKKFPAEKINELTIEKYVIGGDKSKDSFCYWIENRLKDLGNIHGATALKFGIYYGITKTDPILKYRFVDRFGDDENEAFENVKNAIVELLNSAIKRDIEGIRENPISPMFKGKILSTYYPEEFLNIFANEHLEHFLDKLEIPYEESNDEIANRHILLKFKNEDELMSKWTVYDFSKFLYNSFGKPLNKEDFPEALKEYVENKNEYPKLNEVNATFIDININPDNLIPKRGGDKEYRNTRDFETENKKNKLLGNRGEEIVFTLEKKYLKSKGKNELAEKVEWVSEKGLDYLGYDILSFEENGDEKYIEVKSTSQLSNVNANFIISSNQYFKAKKLTNYYFYVVFNTKSKEPKIWKIKDPLNYENKGLTLTPTNYRVLINTSS